MPIVWTLTYQTKPGDDEQTIEYKTASSLQKKIREITSNIDIDTLLEQIEEVLKPTNFDLAKEFLSRYVKCGIAKGENIPEINKSDIKSVVPNDDNEENWEYDEDDEFEFRISTDKITIGNYESEYYLKDNIVKLDYESDFTEKEFLFWVPNKSKCEFHEVYLKLTAKNQVCPKYTSSSYPILILQALKQFTESKNPTAISKAILKQFDVSIERTTIRRNISLLKTIGYEIETSKKGYHLIKNAPAFPTLPVNGFKTAAYPVLILIALENAHPDGITENEILDFLWKKYSTKIDRRTLKTHIEALRKVGFDIKSEKGKHYLI